LECIEQCELSRSEEVAPKLFDVGGYHLGFELRFPKKLDPSR
jgi:hypothetical protein